MSLLKKALKASLPDDGDIDENLSYNIDDISLFFPKKLIADMNVPEEKRPIFTISLGDIEARTMKFENFGHVHKFKEIATVCLDKFPRRQTLIRFVPTDKTAWCDQGNWVYIFTVNDHIVKIGGTKNGLKQRAASYLCGHHTRKSNACSITNGLIYNTFLKYLTEGASIKMYAMRCPPVYATIDVFGEEHTIETQVFDIYEAVLIKQYTNEFGQAPLMSSRADPRGS
jgi:hypothetical protein